MSAYSATRSSNSLATGLSPCLRVFSPILFWAFLVASPAVRGAEPRDNIRLLTMHGETYFTPLIAWSSTGWDIEKPDPQEIPSNQVVAVDWVSRPLLPLHRQPQIMLVNGDRISMVIENWDEEAVSGISSLSSGQTLRIPLEYVRGAILQPLASLRDLAENIERIQTHLPGSDLAILSNGDQIRGQLIRLETGSFRFERDSVEVPLARAQVISIALNPQLSTPLGNTPDKTSLRLTLLDGSRLTLSSWQKTATQITGNLLGDLPVEIPLTSLAGVRLRQDRIQSLTELKPAAFRYTPFLNSSLMLKTDANALGGPLLVGGHPLPTGLGLHSRMEVTYNLDGQFTGFMATFGMDDVAKNRGAAQCRILADGKPLFDIPNLRGGDPLKQTPLLNVTQTRQLTLIVDFGEEGDVLDFVDCCDPLLIK